MTQTVHHRTPPYSRAQLRWAHAAMARGEISPEHVKVWDRRAKRRWGHLPGYVSGTSPEISYTECDPGFPHAAATVKKMGELIREFSTCFDIRHLATEITKDIPSKSPTRELYALYQWVRRNIRYRKDPRSMEWLQSPLRTIEERAGDCDCIATLIGALAESLGHPTRLVTVGGTKLTPKHVAVEAFDGKRWITLDPVIEDSGDTGLSEPGRFGMQARGARVLWDTGGNMIGANEPMRVAAPNTAVYDLWSASSFKLGSLGYESVGDRQIWAVPEGAIPGYSGIGYIGDMGFSLKKIGKAIGKIGKGAIKVVKKVAGTAGKVAKIAAPIVTMLPIPGAQAIGPAIAAGGQMATTVSKVLPAFKKKSTTRAVPRPSVGRPLIRPATPRPIAVSASRPVTARVPSARGGLVDILPMLAASFEDLMNMYKSAAGLSGIKPMLSFTFSGVEETKELAKKAVDAVNTFIKKAGQPPQIKLAEVKAFQTADASDKRAGALSIDGIWGPNAATAAKWYLGTEVPPVAKPYLKYKVTWAAPKAAQVLPIVPKPLPAPEPSPVVVAPKPVAPVVAAPKPAASVVAAPKPAAPVVVAPKPAAPVVVKPTVITPETPLAPPPPSAKPVVVTLKPKGATPSIVPPAPVVLKPVASTTPPVVSIEPQPPGPPIVPIRQAAVIPSFAPISPITADQMPPLKVDVTKTVPTIPKKPVEVPPGPIVLKKKGKPQRVAPPVVPEISRKKDECFNNLLMGLLVGWLAGSGQRRRAR